MQELPDEMPAEVDFSALGPPVVGKHRDSYRRHVRMVQLGDDLAEVFPTEEAVVKALRGYLAEHPEIASGA